jgi:hypothetical protein
MTLNPAFTMAIIPMMQN